MCLARIDQTDEAVMYLDFSCVRILVQFINKDTVDELMDDLIREFLHVRVLADDLHEAPHIVPALRDGADFLFQPADLLHQGGLLVIIAGYHEGKLLIAETAQGVILIELAEKGVSDADGDGAMTDMDNYGYICYGELAADLLFRGAGVKYVDKDPETGRLIDGTTGEKTVDVYSKIYRLLWGSNTTFDIRQSRFSSYLRGKGDRIQEELFTEGRILFYSECMA